MVKQNYTYNANVTSVYDGDTITVNIDLGMGHWLHGEKLRLHRINAPEVRGSEKVLGKVSGDWLRRHLLDKTIIITTIKDKRGKFGRYIAEVYLDDVNINDELVALGLAEYKDY